MADYYFLGLATICLIKNLDAIRKRVSADTSADAVILVLMVLVVMLMLMVLAMMVVLVTIVE